MSIVFMVGLVKVLTDTHTRVLHSFPTLFVSFLAFSIFFFPLLFFLCLSSSVSLFTPLPHWNLSVLTKRASCIHVSPRLLIHKFTPIRSLLTHTRARTHCLLLDCSHWETVFVFFYFLFFKTFLHHSVIVSVPRSFQTKQLNRLLFFRRSVKIRCAAVLVRT